MIDMLLNGTYTTGMPKIDINKISKEITDNPIFKGIIKKDGTLRASKPKVTKDNPNSGKSAYVWRMVAFMISPKRQHNCMPITADFDLPAYDENGKWTCVIARQMAKELDKQFVDPIIDSFRKEQLHGVNRWHKAFFG